MNQTRIGSLIEVAINIAIGFGINWIANLRSISKSMSMDVLKTSYEAAMQMLAPEHHPAIKKAASTRKAELASQPTEETT